MWYHVCNDFSLEEYGEGFPELTGLSAYAHEAGTVYCDGFGEPVYLRAENGYLGEAYLDWE